MLTLIMEIECGACKIIFHKGDRPYFCESCRMLIHRRCIVGHGSHGGRVTSYKPFSLSKFCKEISKSQRQNYVLPIKPPAPEGKGEYMTGEKRTLKIRTSISGVINRVVESRGAIRKDQRFMLSELLRHYKIAKKAYLAGDMETVKEFFEFYVSEEDK